MHNCSHCRVPTACSTKCPSELLKSMALLQISLPYPHTTLSSSLAPFKSPFLSTNTPNKYFPSFLPRKEAVIKPMVIQAKANPRTESPKLRNRRIRKKFTGTPTKPRLSVFCSDKQLYAMLVDDQNKKCLFHGSTLQKSIRGDPPNCTTIEAAERVGEELIKVCIEHDITEISSYDRNGFARGERIKAFETAISRHGFLPR